MCKNKERARHDMSRPRMARDTNTSPTFEYAAQCAATGNVAGLQRYVDAWEARPAIDTATFRMEDLLGVAMVHSARVVAQLNILIQEYHFQIDRMAVLRALYSARCRQASKETAGWPWMRDAQICYPPFQHVASAYIEEFWQQFNVSPQWSAFLRK